MTVDIEKPRFLLAGASCLFVEFADEIDCSANDAVTRLKRWFDKKSDLGVLECMPTYRSLAIYFDPLTLSAEKIIESAQKALSTQPENKKNKYTVISVPVCYGGRYGPDIENVASHAGVSVEGVVARHTGNVCHCYMIGFMPGFAYLGGMDASIATPRLQNPRSVIPGGSVGIAGKQTGIYPMDAPGGWQLIGRTPLKLFMPKAESPTHIKAGYGVRFVSISEDRYKDIASQVASGIFKPELVEIE